MTKMAVMSIYGKTALKNFFPRTSVTILMKLGINHQGLRFIIICQAYYAFLDLFFGNVKFSNLGFYIEKCDSNGFLGNYCSLCYGNWLIYLI